MRPGPLFLLALCLGTIAWAYGTAKKPWPVPAREKERKNPVPASAESIAQGRKLYRNHCLVCHGQQGAGDGPWVSNLPDPPGDLGDPAEVGVMSDAEIFWKVSQGRDFMPGYGRKLRAAERWHLVNYLRTLVRRAERTKH